MTKPTVLAVEDDPASLDLLATRLRALDCHLVSALTPEEAIEAAIAHRPFLALVDLSLNEKPHGGIDVIRALREHPEVPTFPIFIHSVLVKYESEIPDEAGPLDGHLPKPFARRELGQLVARLLGA